jgi:glycosyltransferase involved in cell wall biosynthesis
VKIVAYTATFGAVGCYRVVFPLRELREQGGHDAKLSPYTIKDGERPWEEYRIAWADPRLILPQLDPDVVVLQVQRAPIFETFARKGRSGFVFELDDLYLALPGSMPDASRMTRTNPIMHRIIRACDVLVVSTPELAEAYARVHTRIEVVENRLDWRMWEKVRPNFERERPKVRVGWMGGAKWGRESDVRQLAGIIGPFLESHPQVELVVAGPDAEAFDLMGVPNHARVHIPGVRFDENGPPRMLDFDVGLIPLADTRFNACKSTLKGMEYAAAGIPWVASDSHRGYRELAERVPFGFTARRAGDWHELLHELVTDHDERRALGAAARTWAQTQTVQADWQAWERAWCVGARRPTSSLNAWALATGHVKREQPEAPEIIVPAYA